MSAKIHPTAVVDKSAEFGADVEIGPGCVIGPDVKLGDRTRLIAHVFIESHTTIGPDNTVFPFAGLGGTPQDLSYKGEPTRLEIGKNNVIREHATLHRGTARGAAVTVIGDNCLIMGNCHVAHDCIVGNHVIMAQTATIGGHVKVGDHAFLGGLSGVHQHGRVGRHAFVGASALMTTDLIPFGSAIGNHAHLGGLNLEYQSKRGSGRLGAVRATRLKPGAGDAFKRAAVAAGQREGQFKPAVLHYRRELKWPVEQHVDE